MAVVRFSTDKSRPGRCLRVNEGDLRCFRCVGCEIHRLRYWLRTQLVPSESGGS